MPSSVEKDAGVSTAESAVAPMPTAIQRLGRNVVYFMFILGPLAVFPPGVLLYNSLDTPRRLVLFLGAGLLLALIVKSWAARRRIALRWHALDKFVLCFLLGTVLSGLASSYPRVSFFGPLWSQDGLVLELIGIILYFGIKEFIRTRAEVEEAILVIVSTGALVALVGLFDYAVGAHYRAAHLDPKSYPFFNTNFAGLRVVGTLGNSMFTGTYFALLVPLGIGAAAVTAYAGRRVLLLAELACIAPALLLTMARAAWVGTALSLIIIGVLVIVRFRKTDAALARRVLLAGVITVCVMLGVATLHPAVRARMRSMVNMDDYTMQTRKVYMQAALNIFRDRPIQGAGPGCLRIIFPSYRPYSMVVESNLPLNRGYSTALPHNLFLQTAAEYGLLGLVPFVLLLIMLLYSGMRLQRGTPEQAWTAIGLFGLLTTYLITNQFAFDNAITLAMFWAGAGLLMSLGARDYPLPARYGGYAQPLTRSRVSTLNAISLLLGTIMSLLFLMQFLGAFFTQQGMTTLQQASSKVGTDQERAYNLTSAGIEQIKAGLLFTPIQDVICYQMLLLAYKQQLELTADEVHRHRSYELMVSNGLQGLKLLNRDPIIQRYLAMEFMNWGEYGKSEALFTQLLTFEPRSAELHIMHAELLERQDLLPEAVNEALNAIDLDATFYDAYARLGHLQFKLANAGDPQRDQLMAGARNNFATVIAHGLMLNPNNWLDYITTLLVADEKDQAVTEAQQLLRHLQGTESEQPVLNELVLRVEAICGKDTPTARQLLQAMRSVQTPAPATLPALPAVNPFPGAR